MPETQTQIDLPAGADPRGYLYRWAVNQDTKTLLLFGILAAIGFGLYYAAHVGIPAGISQIQSGYERIDSRRAQENKDNRESFERTLGRFIEESHRPRQVSDAAGANSPHSRTP